MFQIIVKQPGLEEVSLSDQAFVSLLEPAKDTRLCIIAESTPKPFWLRLPA